MLRRVPIAGDYVDLHVFTLLVFDLQRSAIGGDDLHFQFAVGSVKFRVAGAIGQRVLVADVVADIVKDLGKFRLEARLVHSPAGNGSEGFHLVIGLQVINLRNRDAHPV
jgi:hypothetical protein